MLKRYICRLKKNDRGAAIIEFAIALPILVILLLGIIEFGWVLNGYITITGAAREGARVAIVGGDYDDVKDAVDRHIESLPSLSLEEDSPDISEATDVGDELTVTLKGSLPLLIGFFEFLGNEGNFEYTAQSTMRREFADAE